MDHPIVIGTAGGEYMETAVVVEWARALGEHVKVGDTLAVLETAKAGFEIEATHNGVLKEILFEVGDEVPVGAVLGRISDGVGAEDVKATEPSDAPKAAASGSASPGLSDVPTERIEEARPQADAQRTGRLEGRVVATPLARRVARERGIDLSTLKGSGPGGRVKVRDLGSATPTTAIEEGDETSALPAGHLPPAAATPVPSLSPAAATARDDVPAALSRVGASSRPRADGTPIVFIHGFGADKTAWRQVTPLLPRHHPVVLLDLPGHGTEPALRVRGIEDLAFAVADRLQAMGIGEAHLVGHSLGGATALSLAQHGPLTVKSLCLIAPGGLGPEIDSAFLDGFVSATKPESLEPWLARMVADTRHIPPRFAQALLRQREKDGTASAQREIMRVLFPNGTQSIRLSDAIGRLTMPTKLIWGLSDAIIPFKHAFVAPGNVGLHLLRNVGHVPQLEDPALVARLIDELVRSQI